MEEAPSSPRSAALYYWGGGNDDAPDGIADDILPKNDDFYWEEAVEPPSAAARTASDECRVDAMEDWERRRGGRSRERTGSTRRVRLRFTMPIRDEDDDTHWMFLRPHSQGVVSLGGCFVETEAEDSGDDFEEGEIRDGPDGGQSGSLDDSTRSGDATVPTARNDFHSIPIVDLSLPLHGQHGYASRIAEACRTSGFFYIINHGVDSSLMRAVMDMSRNFFALSGDEKAACGRKGEHDERNVGSSNGYRGYFGIGMEDLENKDGTRDLIKEEGGGMQPRQDEQRIKGDQKEGFDCGLECIPGYHEDPMSRQAYLDFFGENYWPDESTHGTIVGFRETLLEYQKALLKLSDVLLIAFAVSLSSNPHGDGYQDGEGAVPADYFLSRSRNPMCTLRLLHYPPAPNFLLSSPSNELLKSPSGCGAHTDYGLFTVLQQDEIGGLQVRNKSNEWIDARPLPGSFVINVGDMLSWWTEGEYASTVHRVISPQLLDEAYEDNDYGEKRGEKGEAGRHRYSIPFFFNPDHDAVVRPIKDVDAVMLENGNWRTAIEILKERYAGTFKSK